MKLKLSQEALASLPQPDEQGIVRVQAALRLTEGGEVDLMEVNDTPVGDEETDDKEPMPAEDLPDLDAAESGINDPNAAEAPLY